MNLIRDEGKVNIAAPQSGWTPLIFFAAKGFYDEVSLRMTTCIYIVIYIYKTQPRLFR